jgi:hypothetical protein
MFRRVETSVLLCPGDGSGLADQAQPSKLISRKAEQEIASFLNHHELHAEELQRNSVERMLLTKRCAPPQTTLALPHISRHFMLPLQHLAGCST